MKLKFKYSLFLFVTFFVNSFLVAQTVLPQNELDLQYTPKGSGPLSASSKSSSSSSNSYNGEYPKNIIKITPTLMPRSVVAFHYERNFHQNFSLQGGIGFNFNKDRLFSSIGSNLILSEDNNVANELSSSEVLPSCVHDGVSPYFYFAPKFIYESYFFDGMGFVEFAFMNYANKLNYVMPSTYSSSSTILVGDSHLKYNFNVFALKYGYQVNTEGKVPTTHEFYFTMGYRMTTYNPVTYNYNNQLGYQSEIAVLKTKVSQPSFIFGVGYTFGIGF